jgi:hypothetical protein
MERSLAGQFVAPVLLLLLAVGCGGSTGPCPGSAEESYIRIFVNPKIRAAVTGFQVELCQEDRCERVSFPARSPNKYGVYTYKGIGKSHGAFYLEPETLGGTWEPDAEATIDVRGVGRQGRTVLRRTETFTFENLNPGGNRCDPDPTLVHKMEIGPADRVAPS